MARSLCPGEVLKADVDVDEAITTLLGLARADDDENTMTEKAQPVVTGNGKKRLFLSKLPGGHVDLTKKGELRFSSGDNRVRPPKAATKLLPEAKWRHIRLPEVESALEAEDLVVLWGYLKYPKLLPKEKAESHLNFKVEHYDGKCKVQSAKCSPV